MTQTPTTQVELPPTPPTRDPPRGPSVGAAGNPFRFRLEFVMHLEHATYTEAVQRFNRIEAEMLEVLKRNGLRKNA